MIIEVDDLINGYIKVCDTVLQQGSIHAPRNMRTAEIIGAHIILNEPHLSMPIGINRKLNPAIGVAEGLQLIAGESHPDLMLSKFPNFQHFTNGGAWFHGAYGPRIKRQIPKTLRMLKSDSDSRQALVTIWDPAYDGFGDVNDTPCTISLQFFIRNDKLHMVTYMRSNDVWWGLAYDAFQFTLLQINMAEVLDVGVGKYHHMVGSLHLYGRDWDSVDDLLETDTRHSYAVTLLGKTWEEKRRAAHHLLIGTQPPVASTSNLLFDALHYR